MMYVKYLEARKLIGRGQRQNELGTNFSKGGTNSSRIEERERKIDRCSNSSSILKLKIIKYIIKKNNYKTTTQNRDI